MTLTGRQVREARELLKWGRVRLVRSARIPITLIEAIESSEGPAWLTETQEAAVRRSFEAAGIVFIEAYGEEPSVRLGKDAVNNL